MKQKKILFVCLGNICRSPAAEGIFKYLTKDSKEFHVESRGTSAFHVGSKPSKNMLEVAEKYNIKLDSFSAPFKDCDFEDFDYIFAADSSVLENLKKSTLEEDLKKKLHLYTAFSKLYKNEDILDPYYGTKEDYKKVFNLLLEILEELKQYLLTK
ncbi:Low molecular weight phosphotyrosine protein phosphatase [Chlamydiales bacterium SCGC AB-751-O23]|jgi:protein-tyrosine phosphatase|nr:Low molecular weight phosphotyrosine protein phosphatase [Chlamydiales bacterium SCGC AB-751-O23]